MKSLAAALLPSPLLSSLDNCLSIVPAHAGSELGVDCWSTPPLCWEALPKLDSGNPKVPRSSLPEQVFARFQPHEWDVQVVALQILLPFWRGHFQLFVPKYVFVFGSFFTFPEACLAEPGFYGFSRDFYSFLVRHVVSFSEALCVCPSSSALGMDRRHARKVLYAESWAN